MIMYPHVDDNLLFTLSTEIASHITSEGTFNDKW